MFQLNHASDATTSPEYTGGSISVDRNFFGFTLVLGLSR